MADQFNFIAIAGSETVAHDIEQAVTSISRITSEIRTKYNGTPMAEVLSGANADVLLIDLDLSRSDAQSDLERVMQSRSPSSVTLVTSSADLSLKEIRQLLRLGIDDFIPQPLSSQEVTGSIVDAINKIQKQSRSGDVEGHTITFLRSCGGVGATTLAVQMAAELQSKLSNGPEHKSIGLLDFDLQSGNLALSLDLAPTATLADVVEAGDRLDPSYLESTMATHKSGLKVLSNPEALVPLDALTPNSAANIVETTKSTFDYTLVDMPHAWTNWTQSVLEHTDLLVLVTEVNVVSVQRTHRILDALRRFELEDLPKLIVASKFESNMTNKQRLSEAEDALALEFDGTIRLDTKTTDEARNRGVFLSDVSDRSPVIKDMSAIVDKALSIVAPSTSEFAELKPEPLLSRFRLK